MRVLLLTPFAPNAPHDHAAADTMAQLAPRLAKKTDLFVYSPQRSGAPDSLDYELIQPHSARRSRHVHRFGIRPGWLREAWPRQATKDVLGLIDRIKPDVVHAEYLQSGEILQFRKNVVLGLHDITERVSYLAYRRSSGLSRAYRYVEYRRSRAFERMAVGRAAAVVTLSEPDFEDAAKLNKHVFLARPGIDVGPASWVRPGLLEPIRLVFVGAMWRTANAMVAKFLAREVMPLVWTHYPNAQLRLVGARPAEDVVALARHDHRITVTGAVPDLDAEMRQAHAVVVPSILGGGILMKVLRAMALGCPVVTSPGPAAAVDADRSVLLIGTTGEEIAAAIRQTLEDLDEAEQRGRRARAHVSAAFRWDRCVSSYLDAYAMVSNG